MICAGSLIGADNASPEAICVLSVGVDIIDIARIARALDRFGDRFLARVYTPAEIIYWRGRVP